jgi:hypothetical protein
MAHRRASPLLDILASVFMHTTYTNTNQWSPAHMNLNQEYLPYKHLIGQIIMDASHD